MVKKDGIFLPELNPVKKIVINQRLPNEVCIFENFPYFLVVSQVLKYFCQFFFTANVVI